MKFEFVTGELNVVTKTRDPFDEVSGVPLALPRSGAVPSGTPCFLVFFLRKKRCFGEGNGLFDFHFKNEFKKRPMNRRIQ